MVIPCRWPGTWSDKGKNMRPVRLIGSACGLGAQDRGCQDGPLYLRALDVFQGGRIPVAWGDMVRQSVSSSEDSLAAVREVCLRLADDVHVALEERRFPLVVGGDHSCAVGTWSGARRWLGGRGPLGLVWVDAHMDSHTFATTPSGALHGMPLACLLGYGDAALTGIAGATPKLLPQHVCLLGVRSYEDGEAALLRSLGVRVIDMAEIHIRGVEASLAEALSIARSGTAGYGLSLDLDVLDPGEEPGVGSPEADGLPRRELQRALHQLWHDPALLAMEIVEYNPHRDRAQMTAWAAGDLFRAVLAA
jgi:arginase